jgi:hypothetical protein
MGRKRPATSQIPSHSRKHPQAAGGTRHRASRVTNDHGAVSCVGRMDIRRRTYCGCCAGIPGNNAARGTQTAWFFVMDSSRKTLRPLRRLRTLSSNWPERWLSGLKRTPGEREWANTPPWVRIPVSPPDFKRHRNARLSAASIASTSRVITARHNTFNSLLMSYTGLASRGTACG